MSKLTLSNERSTFTVRVRAVCQDDNFKGDWHEDPTLAYKDARAHRAIPGNGGHIIDIVHEQTLVMPFTE